MIPAGLLTADSVTRLAGWLCARDEWVHSFRIELSDLPPDSLVLLDYMKEHDLVPAASDFRYWKDNRVNVTHVPKGHPSLPWRWRVLLLGMGVPRDDGRGTPGPNLANVEAFAVL